MKSWAMGEKHISSYTKHIALVTLITGFGVFYGSPAQAQASCNRMLTADVVAFDMPLMFNRLGAQNINGMMYALRGDVVDKTSLQPISGGGTPGNVTLRPDKRPRPLVLRMGAGDCMAITLTNLLAVPANPFEVNPKDPDSNCNSDNPPAPPGEVRSGTRFNCEIDDQVAARDISLRFQGTELVNSINDDGSYVGKNSNSLVSPSGTRTFTIHAPKDGAFLGVSYGGTIGGEGLGGQTASGLWAVLNVNAEGASFYRSQLTNEELELATTGTAATGHPIIDYEAKYPNSEPWISEGKANLPIINMFRNGEMVHTAIDAIVAYGPNLEMVSTAGKLGQFPANIYPLESVGYRNPTVPNRLEPFREFTVAFHDEVSTKQAFPKWFEDPVLGHTLHGVRDSFMINYGSGGIGSEIIANRLGVGPMHDCVNCAYEEFFLTFYTVGEVGQLTDIPANFGLENCDPTLANCASIGPKANYVLYPEDPSNVHHSYTGDATAFRNLHAGPGEQHVFHLHNHQWLFNADDDNSNYLDAQGLGPGSGYAYWINFGGSGNRNKTAGDAIFHCHFYPHFAQGMWEMWRNHDAFEPGTELQATVDGGGVHTSFADPTGDGLGLGNGTPAAGARALPDAEIIVGAPTPAVVPLPGMPMAPMPAAGVTVVLNNNQVKVCLDADGFRVPRDAATGDCLPDTTPTDQAVGSLTSVDRSTVFGAGPGGSDINPGYPFWIAGMEHTVGNRPTTPPLDMISNAQATILKNSGDPLWSHPGFADADAIDGWDGGLPRFALEGYAAGSTAAIAVTRLDMSKAIKTAKPVFFPEEGTDLEQVAMAFHAERCHDTALSDGKGSAANCTDDSTTAEIRPERGGFITNGAKPVPGAPFQEPCIDDRGALLTGSDGWFFGGNLAPMWDTSAMTVRGASPHSATDPRYYKAANVQFDAVFNKLGYHFPQERIITLWQDVVPTIKQERPPEPFVMRLNTFDCTQYVHSNVVPQAYELDDYQVRTPTDIIGQHIHLPKWDLVSADGSANGWNYEDGTLSPQAVVEMITAINHFNADPANTPVTTDYRGDPVIDSDGHSLTGTGTLKPSDHPFFGDTEFSTQWKGARSTLQRWFADPVVNVQGVDRGLGIIFTHDHYGPSTHQQVGLYATVLVEPAGSKWVHNEEGVQLGLSPDGSSPAGRVDGGPTSWQAAILTGDDGFGGDYSQNVGGELINNYREFYLEYTDFQHAYQPGVFVGIGPDNLPLTPYDTTDADGDGFIDNPIVAANPGTFRDAIQPPYRQQASLVNGFPVDIWEFPPTCPGGVSRPCPEAIAADDPGMYVVNYRNESLTARIYDPKRNKCPDGKQGCQAKGRAGDLAFAMQTRTDRAIGVLNKKYGGKIPVGYKGTAASVFLPPINQTSAIKQGDPFTPTLRAFDGDEVHVKVQSGGQEEEHSVSIHGVKWLQSGSGFGDAKNSGWRNAQAGGISEQFNFGTSVFADHRQSGSTADYAYTTNASLDGWVTGTWGVLRSYRNNRTDLFVLPGNDPTIKRKISNRLDFDDEDDEDDDGVVIGKIKGVCPKTAPKRVYDVTAVLANRVLPKQPKDTVDIQDLFPGAHMGRSPKNNRRTLVYNSRRDQVGGQTVWDEESGEHVTLPTHTGPLHDPTGILYVFTKDLKPTGDVPNTAANRKDLTVPVTLRSKAPIEPLVLRASAGDCIKVKLRNRLLNPAKRKLDGGPVYNANGARTFECKAKMYADELATQPLKANKVKCDVMPDLPSGNSIPAMVRRDRDAPAGMTSFQTNLMAPSAHVGLHPALVEYDVTRADGVNVGINATRTVAPGRRRTYHWYAGHLEAAFKVRANGTVNKRVVKLQARPIEFGGFNLMPADKIKQGQKGLIGAGVIYPAGATWSVDGGSNAAATVTTAATSFRDFTVTAQKGASMYYSDTYPVENLLGEGDFGVAEDAQDMGHMAINYGTEPMWFRFGKLPTKIGGNAMCGGEGAGACLGGVRSAKAAKAFSNKLVGGNPETAVFTVAAGDPFRMHVLMPFSPGRGSTYDLHGHVWQRDPYICPWDADLGLAGKCDMGNGHAGQVGTGSVGSQNLGDNPLGFYLGGIESWISGQHYEIVIPSAGGSFGVKGDYLFRDHMGIGTAGGLWGILRVTR